MSASTIVVAFVCSVAWCALLAYVPAMARRRQLRALAERVASRTVATTHTREDGLAAAADLGWLMRQPHIENQVSTNTDRYLCRYLADRYGHAGDIDSALPLINRLRLGVAYQVVEDRKNNRLPALNPDTVSRWLLAGHTTRFFIDCLAAKISETEIRAFLDGDLDLDPDGVALLLAFRNDGPA